MTAGLITRRVLIDALEKIGQTCAGRVLLLGEATQVYEGWRAWTDLVCLSAEMVDRRAWRAALQHCRSRLGVRILEENPAEIIPLPDGYPDRARFAARLDALEIAHFDPYSVAFRHIARGDEPDYHLVLAYIKHGWIEIDTMNRLLQDLLPRFTTATIQQDPAEFRRKYKGLMQMARRLEPGTVHRPF